MLIYNEKIFLAKVLTSVVFLMYLCGMFSLKFTQVSQVCLRLFRGNLSLNEGDSAANAVSERNLQRKITKTRQQMQQKELAKLK